MAPQQVPQQPNMSWDQILPYFAAINNRKGSMNADISTLFDPQFGIMSNSSAQQSPEELFSMYAPQSMSLSNSSDQTIIDILKDFENGKSPFEIKQAIRNGVNSGAIVSSDGEGKDYLDVVDVIFAEQQMVKTKLDDQNKIYRNAGLPTPDQRFDPQSYMPEQFKVIDDRVAANQPKVDAALAAIKLKYDMMDKNAEDSPVDTLGGIGFGTKKGNQSFGGSRNTGKGSIGSRTDKKNQLLGGMGDTGGGLAAKMKNGSKKPTTREQQIRDSNRQLEIERAGGQAKQIISPNSINQQPVYNPYSEEDKARRMKELIAQRIAQGLDQRGETPTNVALLQRILLNQTSKG
jgi:hypothetical protein